MSGDYNLDIFPRAPESKCPRKFANSGILLLLKHIGNKSAQGEGSENAPLIEKMLTPDQVV